MGKGLGAIAAVGAVSGALDIMRRSVDDATVSAESLGNALGTAGTAKDVVAEAFKESASILDGFDINTQKAKDSFGEFIEETSDAPDMRWMGSVGTYLLALDPAADKARDRFEKLGESLAGMNAEDASASMQLLRDEYKLTDEQLTQMIDMMPDFKNHLTEQATELGKSASEATLLDLALGDLPPTTDESAASTGTQAEALGGLQQSAEDAQEQVETLADEIRNFGETTFDTRAANRELEESLATLGEKLAENGNNFDITTEAGRENEAALDAVAQATNEAAAAAYLQTGSQEEANAKLAEGKQKLIDILAPTYGSRDAAAAYVDQLNLISPEKVTEIVLKQAYEAMNVLSQIEEFQFAPKVLKIEEQVRRNLLYQDPGDPSIPGHANGAIVAYADGGINENVRAMHAFAAGGGVDTGIYSGGKPIIKFAEEETGWESFISGKPDQRERNRQIWVETGRRLGMSTGGENTVYVPTSVTVVDADRRLIGTMNVVADKKINALVEDQAQAARRSKL
ncbi:hypothetical protein [Leucobacter sp. USHLN153]|uniref:hypothetical protein n=1 Tax=Leucobacter sp. USHLN153 TaxID=3081268 RepID=UPI003019EA51